MADLANLRETLQTIDDNIDSLEEEIKLGEALDRLKANPDFKLVIEDTYIRKNSELLFAKLLDPRDLEGNDVEGILKSIDAISDLKRFIGTNEFMSAIEAAALSAPAAIDRERKYRLEVTATEE